MDAVDDHAQRQVRDESRRSPYRGDEYDLGRLHREGTLELRQNRYRYTLGKGRKEDRDDDGAPTRGRGRLGTGRCDRHQVGPGGLGAVLDGQRHRADPLDLCPNDVAGPERYLERRRVRVSGCDEVAGLECSNR